MSVAPAWPERVEHVAETPDTSGLHVHPGWAADMPWVVQGLTGSDADMSLFGSSAAGAVIPRWQQLRDRLLCHAVVHSRQVHRDTVLLHSGVPGGLFVAADADGHATSQPRALLAVSVADCVPIFIVAPEARAVALLHGGWRGVAAGILERGLEALTALQARIEDLYVHLGPAICGDCFEVGAEVPGALGIGPAGITHVDLRAHLANHAISAGVSPDRVSISSFCTRHGASPFFSHRGGCAERQIAVLGIRAV